MKRFAARFLSLFRKDTLDADFREEIGSHLDALIRENVAAGMTPAEARRDAMLRLGGVAPVEELHRDTRGLPFVETLMQDLRFALRTLRRDAGFATIAVLILAIGIGSSTAVFSVVNGMLFQPLPFKEDSRLVWVANDGKSGLSGATSRASTFDYWRKNANSFESVGGFFAFFGDGDYLMSGIGEPERVGGLEVTETFLPTLGVQPLAGRLFTPEECRCTQAQREADDCWGGRTAALMTYQYWMRRFGGDRSIVGKTITLNSSPVTIVGVLPQSFDFAALFAPASRIDLLLPFPISDLTNRWGNTLSVVGRLKPGLTAQSAQAELDVLNAQWRKENPQGWPFGAIVTDLREQIAGRLRRALFVLAGAVGLVMLIVCANLSNLLLARASVRRKEMSVRAALGAGPMRLVRQMLTESIVLSCCGAVLGAALAWAAVRMLSQLNSLALPLLSMLTLDRTALAFAAGLALLAGIAFGLAPALMVMRSNLVSGMVDSSRGSSAGAHSNWLRGAFVVAEVALAGVLLVGAGLLIRSFSRVLDTDLGFRPERVAALRADPGPSYRNLDQVNTYYDRVLRTASAVPGVQSAAFTDNLPLGKNRTWGFGIKGRTFERGQSPLAYVRIVTPGYFKTMGIRLVNGRDFEETDRNNKERVTVINETFARTYWPGRNPIGDYILSGRDEAVRIIGVAADVRHLAMEQPAGLEIYFSLRQLNGPSELSLIVRTALPPENLMPSLRAALAPVAPDLPAAELRTLDSIVDRSASPRRFIVSLLGGFAGVALVLASLGIYGVIAYSVSRRTQEIGIRMALGATAGHVQMTVVRQTLLLAGAGAAIGAATAWVAAQSLSALLYEVSPTDPATYAGVIAVLSVVAIAAGYIPARRASRIDPAIALRDA